MKLCRDLERFSKDMNNRMKHIQVIVIFFSILPHKQFIHQFIPNVIVMSLNPDIFRLVMF